MQPRTQRGTCGIRRGPLPVALLAVWAVGLMAVSGCSIFTHAPRGDNLIEQMVWPGAPETTRIKFIGNLSGERELENGFDLKKEFETFLAGSAPSSAHLANPMGIAVSADGQRIYVTDLPQSTVFVFDLAKRKLATWKPDQTKISGPVGIALDAQENVYVVASRENVVRVFDREGNALRTITQPGMERITGIAIDQQRGRVYVSDTSHQKSSNHKVKVFDVSGEFIKDLGQGKGTAEGCLLFPTYLAVDNEGYVYVTDSMNARVQVFDPESGNVVRTYGKRGNGHGQFERPKGVALDSFGNVYVADSSWANVQIFNKQGQVLLYFGGRGKYPGLLNNPAAMTIDKNNRIYIADTLNFRLSVYQLINTTAEDSFLTLEGAPPRNTETAAESATKKIDGHKEGG